MKNDRVEIIVNDQGNRTTASFISFSGSERRIGDAAKSRVSMNPRNTIFNSKRLIGRKFDDAMVQSDVRYWPFEIFDCGGKSTFQVQYKGKSKMFVSICTESCTYVVEIDTMIRRLRRYPLWC